MAQVARACTSAAGETRAASGACRSSSAGWAPEQEIAVTGEVAEERDGVVLVKAEAVQGDSRIIRRGEAELRLTAWADPSTRRRGDLAATGLILASWSRRMSSWTSRSARSGTRRARRRALGTVHRARRARPPRGGGDARASAHLRGPRAHGPRLPHGVDEIIDAGHLPVPRKKLELSTMRREVDEAMRATSEQLSQMTNLLALVTAPPIETATIRRVEVLLLQPQVAMVVVITSTGGVSKRVISYDEPVDPGIVDWAGSYLNEALGQPRRGLACCSPSRGPSLRPASAPSSTLAPAFTELEGTAEDTLFVEGRERLLSEHRFQELSQIGTITRRCSSSAGRCSRCCASRSPSRACTCASAARTPPRELRSLSLVAANYGLARRSLGAVSVIGPLRMDYPNAIIAVRQAARELSRFVAEVMSEA